MAATTLSNFNVGSPTQLQFLNDKLSNLNFLIDTGAPVSAFPSSLTLPLRSSVSKDTLQLHATNGTSLRSKGLVTLPLDFGFGPCIWQFHWANVAHPILGRDFLLHHNIALSFPHGSRITLSQVSVQCPFSRMVAEEFPLLLKPKFNLKTPHSTQHHIVTQGPPVAQRPRRLLPDKYKIAKAEFDQLESLGIVRKSSSPWASPLHMVPKML